MRPTFTLFLAFWTSLAAAAEDRVDFSAQIRPILSDHCFRCHGPDEQTREGGLRLDRFEDAIRAGKSGRPGIVPGQPEASEVLARIFTPDAGDIMPPPEAKKPLTDTQRRLLRDWIAQGAEYRPHWSFQPPRKPTPPAGTAHPIDAFIQARLAREGWTPAPEADPATLLRRVSLDLTGLPPTPEELEAFLRDPSPAAYAATVERLLTSPHYGERWARQWLDLARYADTNGYEKDRPRVIWPWRDWVIRALNADVPFDRFSIEQVAGDLLPNATLEQRIATGLHRNTMINEEGGIDPLEFRYHAMADRLHVTGVAWLGLTLQCAQCHTHKYDPITHQDYFGMMAFLNNADEPELEIDPPPDPAQRARDLQRAEALLSALPDRPLPPRSAWAPVEPLAVRSESGQAAEIRPDDSVFFPAPGADRDVYTLEFQTGRGEVRQLRLEALADPALPSGGPGRAPHGNFVLSEITVSVAEGEAPARPVKLVQPKADVEQEGYPIAHALDGQTKTGWAVHRSGKWNVSRAATFDLAAPERGPLRWTVRLVQHHGQQHTMGRVRISVPAPAEVPETAESRRARFHREVERWAEEQARATAPWRRLRPDSLASNEPILTLEAEDVIFASGDQTKRDEYRLSFPAADRPVTALRLEALPDPRLPRRGPGRVYYEGPAGSFTLTDTFVTQGASTGRFARATASFASGKHDAAQAIDAEPQSGWDINGGQGRTHQGVFVLRDPVPAGQPFTLHLVFERHYAAGLGKFRVWATDHPDPTAARDLPIDLEPDLLTATAQRTEEQRRRLERAFLLQDPAFAEGRQEAENLLQGPGRGRTTLVMQERPVGFTRKTFRHHRGEFTQPKEEVTPRLPDVLPPLAEGQPVNRLGFAHWLVARNNPLTARVVVNRAWATLFGQGLVRTLDDFGLQGELPSHPELLDWLAVTFMEEGWSLKSLHRRLVTSATYRQSSQVEAGHLARDPGNRWLARAARPRLEAEQIRDSALRAAGLLSPKMFGPGVFPPQPASITTEGAYGAFEWKVSAGEDRYRRGLYTFMKRTAPYALGQTFDAPSGEACLARREMTNTPLQALSMLNDASLLEAARHLGTHLAQVAQSTEDAAVGEAFRRVLCRDPQAEEIALARDFLSRTRTRYLADVAAAQDFAGEGQGNPVERAVWAAFARATLNLDEFITRN
jgi:hypothetical protein